MLKKLIILFFFICSITGFSQERENLKWEHSYKRVLKLAKKNKKPILVYFSGSDWCAPCVKLKKDFFDSDLYTDLFNKFNLLYIDIPQRVDIISPKQYIHNQKVLKELNPKKVFPKILVLNKKGKIKDTKSGYSSIAEPSIYTNMLKKYVD